MRGKRVSARRGLFASGRGARRATPKSVERSGAGRAGITTVLDVGSSKVACLIARMPGEFGSSLPEIVGVGHQLSEGVRSGAVVDMDLVGKAIRNALEAAETMAGLNVQKVLASVNGGAPESRTIHVELDLHGSAVSDQDVRRVVGHGKNSFDGGDQELLHVLPVGYSLDGCRGIKDPREMFGDMLGVDLHFLTAASGPLRNLRICVERCHIDLAAPIFGAYASGLGCLVDDEMDLGVTLIDMGAGTTSLGVFAEGELQYGHVLNVGGQHATRDIARGLSAPIEQAERLKVLYGSVLRAVQDDQDVMEVSQVGEAGHSSTVSMPRSLLTQILRARLEETFELVRDHLNASGYGQVAGNRVVLTGGASQLNGVRELAAEILGKQVRLATPEGVSGYTEGVSSPVFASAVGMLRYAARTNYARGLSELDLISAAHTSGRFGWFGKFLGDDF